MQRPSDGELRPYPDEWQRQDQDQGQGQDHAVDETFQLRVVQQPHPYADNEWTRHQAPQVPAAEWFDRHDEYAARTPAPAEPAPQPKPQPAAPEPAPARRFAAVDGLRGIAIISILLYHTSWFANGLFGVDAFFVLSGFLVTLLLVREVERSGRIRLFRFYKRRFKRLIPGLLVILTAVVALAYLLGTLREAKTISHQAITSLFQYANWAQLANGNAYWEGNGTIDPLAAMWSLSVTEQFYLVWPLVLGILCLVCRRRIAAVTVFVVLLFAGSAAVAPLLFTGTNTDEMYLSTHTRAVAFMAGAAAACIVHLIHRRADGQRAGAPDARATAEPSSAVTALLTATGILALVAIVALSVLVDSYHKPWLYQGGLAVVAALVALLAAVLCTDRGPLVKLLSGKIITEIGQLSYTIYLLHLPIYWLLQKGQPDVKPWALLIVGGGITWFLALLLHYVVTERLRLRDWRPLRAVPLIAVACVAITAGAYYLPTYTEQEMRPGGKPLVITAGDSLANDLATGLSTQGKDFGVIDGGIAGCGLMGANRVKDRQNLVVKNSDECRESVGTWSDLIREHQPQAVVVHIGWDATLQDVKGDGTWMSPCDADYRTRYTERLKAAVTQWREADPNVPILLMNERTGTGATTPEWARCFNAVVSQYVTTAKVPQLRLVDFAGFLCPEGRPCQEKTPRGKRMYPAGDDVHLTSDGMAHVTPWLEEQLHKAVDTEKKPA
ncbi:acyltransferase family protein [Streptomyces sp. NPDC059989]|uniref:acyltransferase family protein n=1 Tax=Streptomyces sp. NPDC059989 TaxID=3347026 RepID=UPI0036772F57